MFTKGRYYRKSLESKGQVVPKTLANFLERKTQLYEQGATVRRIGQYVIEISYKITMFFHDAKNNAKKIVHKKYARTLESLLIFP